MDIIYSQLHININYICRELNAPKEKENQKLFLPVQFHYYSLAPPSKSHILSFYTKKETSSPLFHSQFSSVMLWHIHMLQKWTLPNNKQSKRQSASSVPTRHFLHFKYLSTVSTHLQFFELTVGNVSPQLLPIRVLSCFSSELPFVEPSGILSEYAPSC